MITLHLRQEGKALCLVCGANTARAASHWWLSNCWTTDRDHYRRTQAGVEDDNGRVQTCVPLVIPQPGRGTPLG